MRAGIWRAVLRSVHVRVEELFSVTTLAVFLLRVANFKMETMSANHLVTKYTGLHFAQFLAYVLVYLFKHLFTYTRAVLHKPVETWSSYFFCLHIFLSFKVQAFALFLVTLIITPLIIKYITSWAPAPTP